ncbi:hypothetical protein Emag_002960 [Eimeria magna]
MIAEEPPSFVGGPIGAPGAADRPQPRSLGTLDLEQSYSLEDEAEGGLSPSSVTGQRNKKNSRKRPRVSRKRLKTEPAEAPEAPEAAPATAAAGVGSSLNSSLVAPPLTAPVYAPPFQQQQAALLPPGAVTAPLPPAAGPPSVGDQGQMPIGEAVPGAQPPYLMQQGYCMQQQGLGWLPGKTQEATSLPQGPLSGGGGPVGPLGDVPPTEGEVKALIAFLTKRPMRSLKLASCLMEEVERVWWQAKQQQQQHQGNGGEQLQQQLNCSAGDQVATQGNETRPALGPPHGSLQNLSAGVPLSLETPEEARPATAAAASATVVDAAAVAAAAAAAACNPVTFATAEAFDAPQETAGAGPTQQPPPVTLCVSSSEDCSLPFQPLQQHGLGQQQLGQQQLQGLPGQQQLPQLRQQQLQQQQQQLSQLQQQPQQLTQLQQQQQQLPQLQQQQQQLPQQQDCHEASTLDFDEAPMLQLDTSPKLLVGEGGGASGPPASTGSPSADNPPLSWLSG